MTITTTENIPEFGNMKFLLRLWRRLHPRRRKQSLGVLVVIIVGGLAEVISIGAVIPFATVLVSPERVFQIAPVSTLARILGLDRPDDLVVPLAAVFIVGVLLAVAIRLALVWATTRLAVAIGADLSAEAYERTLYQPYATHLDRNTSEVTSGVIHKVEAIISGMLIPFQTAVGAIFSMVMVTAALVLIDPIIALITLGAFGGGYVASNRVFRERLALNSRRIAREQTRVMKAIQEGIGGIRDVIIDGTRSVFLDEFRSSDRPVRHAKGSNSVIQQAPRVLMDGVAMLLISILAVVLSSRPDGIVSGLPILGALALGGQRLLPLYQQCYSAVVLVQGNRALLVIALEILEQPMPPTYGLPTPSALDLRVGIECQHLRFRYTDNGLWVVDDLNLTIRSGTRLGLVGMTGCGKSTLLDLLMGLLVPDQGAVLVDGQRLEGNRLRGWQRSIAHVPQHVFLSDASLAENIAFGIPVEEIDMDRVREAARHAMIAEFIEAEPAKYATVVGERGLRLSGGQRQRIGIARALYKRASVLIIDEATSALDNQTERSVMHSLADLDRELTVVVAHRLSTLKDRDVIVEMRDGRIVGAGAFEDLMSTSHTFRETALAVESEA